MVHLLCLANSKKYHGHCIAGIQVRFESGVVVVQKNIYRKPQWIRPVSCKDTNVGELSTKFADKINVLDIISFDILEQIPNSHQVENVLIDPDSLCRHSKFPVINSFLDSICNEEEYIFGNSDRSIPEADINKYYNSLVLIKPERLRFIKKDLEDHLRVQFYFENNSYYFPITDINFNAKYANTINETHLKNIYFVISLAAKSFQGFFYKLVAGVVYEQIDK